MGSILRDWADSFSLWLIQARMLNLSMRENEQEPQQMRAFGAPLTERKIGRELLFLAAVAERTLVNDALSGDTFCAEMFSTGAT